MDETDHYSKKIPLLLVVVSLNEYAVQMDDRLKQQFMQGRIFSRSIGSKEDQTLEVLTEYFYNCRVAQHTSGITGWTSTIITCLWTFSED